MKVGINARLLQDPSLRGWNRYTINLLGELIALGVELVLYTDAPLHPSHLERLRDGNFVVCLREGLRYPIWEQYWLPRQCEQDRVDVLHSPFNFGLPWWTHCPRVLTLHDAIDQVFYKADWTSLAVKSRLYHWSSRTRANRIITVSEHARQDLISVLRLPEWKIQVIHEAADTQFPVQVSAHERDRIRRYLGIEGPYLLYVGGWERRKNVAILPRALRECCAREMRLVLVGGREEEREVMSQMCQTWGIADRVSMLGWVEDSDLPALYAESFAFVYPSFYEGFGLQLCEAMSLGCPVLASSASCLPEILGNGGLTFDPNTPSTLTSLIDQLISTPAFRDILVARALVRAGDFSWKRAAAATLSVYEDAISTTKTWASRGEK